MAHFEVFILNYNGAHFLPECLDSLESIDKGSHTVTTNVVDNGSADNSADLVEKHYRAVNFIKLNGNFGFSKGNNLGVQHRRDALKAQKTNADYYVFLNNDTKVEKNWLLAAANELEADKKLGIVGSKSLFYDRFCPLAIAASPTFLPTDFGSNDTRELALFLKSSLRGENIHTNFRRGKLKNAYNEEGTGERQGRWLAGESEAFIAVADKNKKAKIYLTFENHHPEHKDVTLNISLKNTSKHLLTKTVKYGSPEEIRLTIEPGDFVDVIQNAGSYVTSSLEGGDVGFLDIDDGRHDKSYSPNAICGVSCFIRSKLFDKLNGFDERYFAYYEDTDLSLRAKALGYSLRYIPQSVLRHVHCGSGVEFSDYFNENVAYSHLIFSSKFMKRSLWKKKLAACKLDAKREFESFYAEGMLGNKPHLRAYCRYIKYWPYFNLNRVRYSSKRYQSNT